MAAPIYYPKPDNPTGFVVYNPQFTKGTILFLHGIGGIGAGTMEGWGLPALISRGELPPDLIKFSEIEEMVLIAPQCDRPADQGGWSHQMVDNVLNHAAVKNYPKETFHANGNSLGAGELALYMLQSQTNAAKFATAFVCYTTSVNGTHANIVNAKTLVVGLTASNDSNGGTKPAYTTSFIDSINNAGANPKAVKNVFTYGDHLGAMGDVYKGTQYSWLDNLNMYDYMKAHPRGSVTPVPPTKVVDHKFQIGTRKITGYTDKTWEEI